MKAGWKGMQQALESVFAGGTKGISVFEGLSSQIRRLGVGENLIEMIVGMDPDEYNKRKKELFVFDKAGNIVGTTAKLKNMNAAFNAIAIGEYINSQQSFIENARNQSAAISILTANGMSLSDAYQLVQDEALAAAIAMGATKAEIQEILRITGLAKQQRENMEKEQERSRVSDSVRKTNEEFRNQVAVLNQLSKAQGKYTDAQIQAIMSDKDLQTLFLNPNIDPNALQEALKNAEQQANLELKIKVTTEEGKEGLFNELVSEITDEFSRQEAKINIDFNLATENDQDIAREAQNRISAIQFAIDDYEAQLKGISDQEEVINDKYDKRSEALDEISKVNEKIARQQKSQLDIADALSRGDISAAARAVQELRAQQAEDASSSQKEMLEKQKEAELASVTGTGGQNRKQIEESIKQLRDEIFGIEESELEPAQERIRIAEYNRDLQIDALEVSGKTREQWEQIANQVDLATQNTEEFAKSVERALALFEYFVNDAPLDLSLFGEAMESQLKAMGVDVETQKQVAAIAAASISETSSGMTDTEYMKFVQANPEVNVGSGSLSDERREELGISPRIPTANITVSQNENRSQQSVIIPAIGGSKPVVVQSPRTSLVPSPQSSSFNYVTNNSKLSNQEFASALQQDLRLAAKAPAPKPKSPMPTGGRQPYIKLSSGGMIVPSRMAMGGSVKGYPMGGLIPYKAEGGFFKSLGSDTVPAMLTPGEFVVRRPAVTKIGVDNLEKINRGTYSGGSVYNYNLAVNVKSESDPNRIARTVIAQIKQVDNQRIRGNKL
jgi:hypothetical protein